MITSMNQSELYKTLVGHYKPNYHSTPDNSKPAEKTKVTQIAGVSVEDIENALKESANGNMKNKAGIDLANDPNMDRFEPSKLKIAESKHIGLYKDNLKEMPYAASDAINFLGNNIRTELEKGYANGVVTKERIAEYYGAMAKRLDNAYAEGKFTKDEFDELNEMITSQVEKDATAYERLEASYALGEKRGRLSPEAVAEIVQREKSLTPEERLAAREQEIRDYAERYCKIDRVALMKLFISIRYGK